MQWKGGEKKKNNGKVHGEKGKGKEQIEIGDLYIPIVQQSVSMPDEMLVLLHIEEQAIVQVIIKEVASHLDLKDNLKISTVRWHANSVIRTPVSTPPLLAIWISEKSR